VDGYQLAYYVAVGFLVAAITVAVGVLRPVSQEQPGTVEELGVEGEPAYSEAA
jgi:hypothetical protein